MVDSIFVYTQAIILICMGAAVTSLCVFLATRRRSDLARILVFVAFMLENSFALLDEYDGTKELVPFSQGTYLPPHPIAHHAISLLLVLGVWMLVCELLDLHSNKVLFAIPAAVTVVQIAVFFTIGETPFGQQLFFLIRDLCGALIAGILLMLALKPVDELRYPQVTARKRIFFVVLLFLFAVFVEDLLVALAGPEVVRELVFAEFLIERNVSENLMCIFYAGHVIKKGASLLSLRYSDPAKKPSNDRLLEEETRFRRFATSYDLTDREREMLELIIVGKTNREIAQELFISEGTARSHVSHIFSKCGASSRSDLIRLFWRQE